MTDTYSQTATQPLDESLDLGSGGGSEGFDAPHYWARLYPAQENVRFHELTQEETTVGKLKTCDVCLQIDELPHQVWVVLSRHQFSILKVAKKDKFSPGLPQYEILLEDKSMNGTFINGTLVGRDLKGTLKNNDIISVGKPANEIYFFRDTSVNKNLPKELVLKYDDSIQLGRGAYGEVSLVFCKETGRAYAMKSILKGSKINPVRLESEQLRLENEIRILRSIDHPHVIRLMDDLDCLNEQYLFLEMMRGRDLFHRITNSKRLTESQAKMYFFQIASGVEYLHRNDIIHRDLKPENVLLATLDVDTVVKISDFGLSKVLYPQTYLRSMCGTKLYVAPEVLTSGGSEKYTGQVDVWSIGVILYVCLSGRTPFTTDRNGKTMDEQIKQGEYDFPSDSWECVSLLAMKIVKRMMTVNPESRISITSVLRDPWLKDPRMRAKVDSLVKKHAEHPPLDKENFPDPSNADFPQSPQTASLKSMSASASPARKRVRVQ